MKAAASARHQKRMPSEDCQPSTPALKIACRPLAPGEATMNHTVPKTDSPARIGTSLIKSRIIEVALVACMTKKE